MRTGEIYISHVQRTSQHPASAPKKGNYRLDESSQVADDSPRWPTSSLGRALPKSSVLGHEVIVSVKAFFDSSGKIDGSKFWVLAGVAASERVWGEFDVRWDEILKARTPVAPYLHMRELVSASGAYTEELGWDDTKRQKLLNDCFLYAYNLDKEQFRSFVATLDMTCLRALRLGKSAMPSAVELLNYYVPSKVFEWFCDNINTQKLREAYFYFDQGEPFRGPFENLVRRRKKSSRISNAWHMVKIVAPLDMRDAPQLQLADLVAWSHYRKHSASPASKWHSMSVFTDAGLPSTRVELDRNNLLLILKWVRSNPKLGELFK